ncbi:MAG: hypothetical protein SCH98_04055 [Deferrisomatales bacterium]|nr:hypothetical protein [Deferrisomatales bacterium]
MKCERCGTEMGAGEALAHGDRKLCEDCLMDVLSPAMACDPWAVKLAKGAIESGPPPELQGLEKALFDAVRERGRVPKEQAAPLLGVRPTELERAFAVLRHMELLRGQRREDGGVDYVPFEGA